MNISGAMQWWEQWQLRILVLGSLFVQLFLSFAEFMRRFPALRRLRALVWIAYIGGDALAIYGLATLFNRHKQRAEVEVGGNSALEVIWAPILLIHLGGQPTISAYSLEDNELWMRHALTLASQVTVSVYVFCKWWSGEKRLLQAAILLFVVGILKFGQKPWALRSASFNSMLASTVVSPRRKESPIVVCWKWCTSNLPNVVLAWKKQWARRGGQGAERRERKEEAEGGGGGGQGAEGREGGEEAEGRGRGGGGGEEGEQNLSLEEYAEQADNCVRNPMVANDQKAEYERMKVCCISYTHKMFVDLSAPYTARLGEMKSFLKLDEDHEYKMLQECHRYTFQLLYTKSRSTVSYLGLYLLFLLPFLALASTVLFATSHKDGYNQNDIRVTYILFCLTTVQEFLPFLTGYFLAFYLVHWHDMVSQYNLMSFCAREKKPTTLLKLATLSCFRGYINKRWYVRQVPAALEITKLVRRHIKDGWNEYIRCSPHRYRRFKDLRGQWSLKRHQQHKQVGWSLNLPFDKCVLLWHIATDLCFHHPNTSRQAHQGYATPCRLAMEMSNYMIYLLFIHPEMLMPGSRPNLFTAASEDIELMLGIQDEPRSLDGRSIALGILHAAQFPWLYVGRIGSVIPDACRLAEALMKLGDEKWRWTMIQGVWVEMLCYSASRCRGYLHAKSLGEGGEYLSTVWLLWSFMGMETLADRHHRPRPTETEDEEEGTVPIQWCEQ